MSIFKTQENEAIHHIKRRRALWLYPGRRSFDIAEALIRGKATDLKDMPEFLTRAQVQDVLQISRATFFRWIKGGQMPGAVKVGDSWRVSRDALRDYLYKD